MQQKNIYFCPAEEEMIESLQEMYGIGYEQACNTVIRDKRQNAFLYQQRGNLELAEVLLKELDEWNETWEEEFKTLRASGKEYKKIILPGEE